NRKLATRAMALTEASVVKMRIMTGCYGREETDGPKAVRRCYFSFHTHQARLSVPYERVEGDRYTQTTHCAPFVEDRAKGRAANRQVSGPPPGSGAIIEHERSTEHGPLANPFRSCTRHRWLLPG